MPEARVFPKDCGLIVGIPLHEPSFRAGLARERGYVAEMAREAGWTERSARAAWSHYERRVVAHVAQAIVAVRRAGVDVRAQGSLADVAQLSAKKHVVTLFAHCETEADLASVEIGDALVPSDAFAQALAPGFGGVLDLALCRSWRVGEIVKERRPGCLVVVHRDQTAPAFRATFYRHLVSLLTGGERFYTEATFELAKGILG